MRIGIDCRLAGRSHAGIGRYIESLVIRLPALAPEVEWVYFFHDQTQADEVLSQLVSPASLTMRIVPIRHYSVQEQLKLAQVFQHEKLDLLHVPHFNVPLLYRGKLVVTIHDLLWHEYHGPHVTTLKPWQYWIKYGAYRFVASSAINKADKIFVPAQTIKKTLTKYYPQVASKIEVTTEGIFSAIQTPQLSQSRTKRQVKTLLYVGSLYPHKNVGLIAQALKQLPDYRLLVVGSRNVFQDAFKMAVQELGVASQVELLGYKTDAELSQLYTQVGAVVQPSLSEGFGLTGVEALASGAPLLASQIPIFQEIYHDAAIYFDPHSVESLVKSVKKLEQSRIDTLIKKGQKQAAKYSWEQMADQTFHSYLAVLGAS